MFHLYAYFAYSIVQGIHPCLCRKDCVPAQKYNNVKNQLFTVQVQLTYAEKVKKETEQQCEQRCDEAGWSASRPSSSVMRPDSAPGIMRSRSSRI